MKQVSLASLPDARVSHSTAIRKRVMLKTGDVPHLAQFAQAQFAPGQVAAAHAHETMHEVFFVESGHGRMTVDGQCYPLEAGVCITVSPGEHHEVRNDGNDVLILTYFGILQ